MAIGAFVSIGAGASIGARTIIHPNVVVGPGARIGDDCILHSQVSIRERVVIGHRVVVQDGSVLGSEGFGFAKQPDGTHLKIPQRAGLVVEDDVEIGANTTIDRPAIGETRIGAGTKIDNLVQIGHGVTVGRRVAVRGAGRALPAAASSATTSCWLARWEWRITCASATGCWRRRRPASRIRWTMGRMSPGIRPSITGSG